jgi:hypothetical protein
VSRSIVLRINRKRLAGLLACGLASPFVAAELSAQSIRGTVRDGVGAPFASAEIVVRWAESARQRVARSNEKGAFGIGVGSGKYFVTVRAVGYVPVDTLVEVARANVEINAVLRRITELDTVVVRALPVECDLGTSIEGFNCRRLNAHGYFFDEAEIKRMDLIWMADIFRSVPGFVVEPTKTGRRLAPKYGWGCIVYLVNGRPPLGRFPRLEDILAVEVYKTYADIPKPYRTYAWGGGGGQPLICSIINYWMR